MSRLAFLPLPLLTAACAYYSQPALHDIRVDLSKGEYAWCLSPSGQSVAWASSTQDAMGRTYGTCAPPNRFVRVYACGVGQADAGESPEALAERVRLSMHDHSLVGDTFQGRAFCSPRPPS